MCEDNIEIGVTEITNNILVSATPTDQKIDINVTETTEDVTLNITPSVVEVNIDVTQELITEVVTVDANTCVNIVDVTVTDATDNVTLNITPSIVEVNINRGSGSGSSVWGEITGTLSDQTDLQSALNAKQNLLGYTPVPTTRTITINGTTYDLSANRSWTVAGGLSGIGTTNYLSKWTGASALGNSLVFDDGTNVMIGTTSSLYKLTVNTALGVNFGVGRTSIFGTNDSVFLNSTDDSYTPIPFALNASHIGLYIGYSEALRINASKEVLIGTTTGVTGGGLLQVNGIINSGEYGLLGGYLKLDTTPTTTPTSVGTLSWNDTDGTADLKLKGGNVTLQIGQEEVVRVVNKTGATLNEADFRAVRIRSVAEGGAQGQRLAVVLAQGNNDANSATTIGLVTESIADNQEGFITTFGNVSEIDTTGAKSWAGAETWVDGDMLYLSPTHAGYLTNVKPSAPQHMVIIGYVVYAHAVHGKIFVKVDNGYELDELHNVAITSPSSGQALVYDSANSVWKNSTISSGGVSGSGTTNYLPKWSSSSALTNSDIFDNGIAVGINTATPFSGSALTVAGQIYAQNGGVWTEDNNGFFIGDLSAGASYAFISGVGSTGAASYLTFNTNFPERVRIIANGNVGIGLTNPSYKLDVVGDVNVTGNFKINGVNIGTGGGGISGTGTSGYLTKWTGATTVNGSQIYDNGTNIGIGMTTPLTYKLNVHGEIFAWNMWTQQSAWTIGTSTFSAAITGFGSTGYAGTTNTLTFSTNGSERMRITSGGVILMGTTSTFSNEKMRVVGSASYWGTAIFENNQNQLDVNHGTINVVNTRTTYAIGNDASIMFSAYNSTLSMQPRASLGMKVSSDLGGELVFNTRNNSGYAERMRIKENGIINFANVPTSSAGLSSGDIYKSGSTLMIV